MKIILGKYMDGGAWPDAVTHFGAGQNAVGGMKICGPMGFLSLLEEKLGLPDTTQHGSRRIAVWEGLLKQRVPAEREDGEPFYAESFRADSWNTAKRLLQMRDELKAMGAAGFGSPSLKELADDCASKGLARLAEIFRLEADIRAQHPKDIDTLERITGHIDEWGLSGVHAVALAEPRDCWNREWQTLFRTLEEKGIAVEDGGMESQASALQSPEEFYLLEGETVSEAALALAAMFQHAKEQKLELGRTVLIRPEDSFELDTALHAFGLPGTGCRQLSAARPACQLFALSLRHSLLPFDPEILRHLLLLPLSPIDSDFAAEILAALRRSEALPAHGESWPSKWRELLRGGKEKQCRLDAEKRLETLTTWIVPPKQGSDAASPETLRARALFHLGKLKSWAEGSKEEFPELKESAKLCELLEAHLKQRAALTGKELEQLIDETMSKGSKAPAAIEARPWAVLSSPGQLHCPDQASSRTADTVIWWNCVDDGFSPRPTPWRSSEHDWLEQRGFLTDSTEPERRARSHAMRRPFQHARRLILVSPRLLNGEESSPHPVMALLGKHSEPIRIKAEEVLCGSCAGTGKELWNVVTRTLPKAPERPAWSSSASRTLNGPGQLSPSSLSSLLSCPLRWYLERRLGFEEKRNELQHDAPLLGNMAHSVVEDLLNEYGDTLKEQNLTQEDIVKRLQKAARKEAARFGREEHQAKLQDMAAKLHRSVQELCRFMEKEGFVFLDTERTYKGTLGKGVSYEGRYDLALAHSHSPQEPAAIVDLKWSKNASFREQMQKGSVQLASYWYLLSKGWLETGGREFPDCRLKNPAGHDIREVCYFLMMDADMVRSKDSPKQLDKQWEGVLEQWNILKACFDEGRLPAAREWALMLCSSEEDEDAREKAVEKQVASACKYCAFSLLCGEGEQKKDEVQHEQD